MARKSHEKKGQESVASGAGRAASVVGVDALASRRAAAGSDQMREGMERFLEEVHRRAKMVDAGGAAQAEGYFFEHTLAAKFNTDAANKGLDLNKHGLDARGDNDPVVDLISRDGKYRAQVKKGAYAKKELQDPKYSGVRKVTTKGGADPQRGIEDEVAYGGARASATEGELQFARQNSMAYAAFQELKQVGREAAVAGAAGAASGAVLGGGISAIRNVWAWGQGAQSGQEVAGQIAKDAISSSARAGASAAGSAVVRHVGHKAGIAALKKSNIAAAVASGVLDVTATVWSWAKGDISAEDAAIRLGDTGCGALSGTFGGAAAGAVFGPVGAAVGSAVGYLLSACVYQACVATFQQARLAEEEAERVVALCAEAIRRMDEQRRQFERDFAERLEARQNAFDRHFKRIDAILLGGGDSRKLEKSLSRFARSFGKKLRHLDIEDFKEFMDSKETAVL